MKAPRPVALDVVRQALRSAVERDGLRPVARAVGLTPTGLTKALDPSTSPRGSTQTKMREWYVRNAGALGPTEQTVRAALAVLLDGVPEASMGDAIGEVVGVLRRLYRSVGVAPPEWMGQVGE
jgi:hypothetical protein